MDFSEKLNYLFKLTGAEGKELAAVMSVTPPQISKMRNGQRGLPRSREYAIVLARFFAERCNSDFHRNALSNAMNVGAVKWQNDITALTETILEWLSDDRKPSESAVSQADTFLRQFGALYSNVDPAEKETAAGSLAFERSNFVSYYGNEGKRIAATTFLNYVLRLKKPLTINILTDESIGWSTEDTAYSTQLHQTMVKLSEQGCTFRRISGPISDIDQAFESLNRWFPLYMTGKATSYYYTRMRDSLAKITLFVVRDVAALFSFSIGSGQRNNGVTFFTVDTKTVNSMATEFENYLALCEPIIKVHNSLDSYMDIYASMTKYDEYAGPCIQKSDSLSFITMPWDNAAGIQNAKNSLQKNEFLSSFVRRFKAFKSNLEKHTFVDIIRLASVGDILGGKVPIPVSLVLCEEKQYYTPNGYIAHLKNILFLLEHYKNYKVIVQQQNPVDAVIIYVKENFCTILARDHLPFALYEVSEHHLIDAFAEYLKRLVPEDEAANRRESITAITDLIARLEK